MLSVFLVLALRRLIHCVYHASQCVCRLSHPLTSLQAFIERNGLQTQQAPALPGGSVAAAVLQSQPSGADPGVDVLRLSCAARSNLESAVGAVEYGAASGAAGAPGDVQLHNTDAELDFEEQAAAAGGPGAAERKPVI